MLIINQIRKNVMFDLSKAEVKKVSGAAPTTEAILTGGGALLGMGAGDIACAPVPVAVPFCQGVGGYLGGLVGNEVYEHFFNH